MKTTFIGGGNMATALITGMNKDHPVAGTVRVCDPEPAVRKRLQADFGLETFEHAAEAMEGTDVVVLAVKPQIMPRILASLAGQSHPDLLVISVAAGITVVSVEDAFGPSTPVVRTMPNTPALLGNGITGLFAGAACSEGHRAIAENIMSSVGATVWVDTEGLMDVVTAVSGSGPAYFYLLAEAMRSAGARLGLPKAVASELAIHTAHGAGVMAAQAGVDVAELRRRVTSPGGTTQAALQALEDGGFNELVRQAVEAATRRGHELSAPDGAA